MQTTPVRAHLIRANPVRSIKNMFTPRLKYWEDDFMWWLHSWLVTANDESELEYETMSTRSADNKHKKSSRQRTTILLDDSNLTMSNSFNLNPRLNQATKHLIDSTH